MHDRRSKLTDAQRAWLEALGSAGQYVFVWRPGDHDEILDVLNGATETASRLFLPGATT
jgi:hypothetical protein